MTLALVAVPFIAFAKDFHPRKGLQAIGNTVFGFLFSVVDCFVPVVLLAALQFQDFRLEVVSDQEIHFQLLRDRSEGSQILGI